jgi:hypothetical protein
LRFCFFVFLVGCFFAVLFFRFFVGCFSGFSFFFELKLVLSLQKLRKNDFTKNNFTTSRKNNFTTSRLYEKTTSRKNNLPKKRLPEKTTLHLHDFTKKQPHTLLTSPQTPLLKNPYRPMQSLPLILLYVSSLGHLSCLRPLTFSVCRLV